jgi:hypothetical protein
MVWLSQLPARPYAGLAQRLVAGDAVGEVHVTGEFERSREGMAGRKCREKEGVREERTSMAGEEMVDGDGAVHDTYLLLFRPANRQPHA